MAVITGGSSGIGAAVARALKERGWLCVLLARNEERLRAFATEFDAEWEQCDVADRDQVEQVAARVRERHPQIKLLVNNAGFSARTTYVDGEPERIESVLRTNYLGGIWCVRAFLPALDPPADVVNVVSVAGEVAMGPYSGSKFAQLAFSRSLAVELRPRGIRIHTVKPGLVETPGFPQRRLPRPLRKLVVTPERVAEHILHSLEHGRGETTIPPYYRAAAVLQAVAPNLLVRVVGRSRKQF